MALRHFIQRLAARGLRMEVQQCPAVLDQLSQQRAYATDGGDQDGQESNAAAGASGQEEQPAKRKQARRLTRADKGAWRDTTVLNDEIFETAPVWPENVPIIDAQSQMPWLYDTASPYMEMLKIMRRDNPLEFQALLNQDAITEDGPWPGANRILEWEVNVVFDSNPRTGEVHPMNKKVKCRVYLRDLQDEFKLSDRAVKYMAMIAGPRYNPNKGLLTLTSEKFRQREDNRLHIVDMLSSLIDQGKRTFPEEQPSKRRQRQQPELMS